jgi:cell division protein FtsL
MLSAPGKRSPSGRRPPLLTRLLLGWHRVRSPGPGFAVALALTLAALVVVALLHVWTRLEIVRIGYALSEQTRLHQALREHEQRLRLELASRKDPAAIERAARERLHMTPPDPTAIRVVPRLPEPAQEGRAAGRHR